MDYEDTLKYKRESIARAVSAPCRFTRSKKDAVHVASQMVTGKPFKTLQTRQLQDGWAIVEIERRWQEGFFETVVGRGYGSEQVAEQVALVALKFSEELVAVEEEDC